jgi:hypothetical protein
MLSNFFTSLVFICLSLTIISCKEKKGQQNIRLPEVAATELDARLTGADSLVVVFYKDPYGADSLRYTRYYTQIPVTGNQNIALLQRELQRPFSGQEKRKNCRGEGKIWCFAKGKIFQTLYFSTRCEECCHLYLVYNGNFYYSPILPATVSWLESLKPLATEPANQGMEAE